MRRDSPALGLVATHADAGLSNAGSNAEQCDAVLLCQSLGLFRQPLGLLPRRHATVGPMPQSRRPDRAHRDVHVLTLLQLASARSTPQTPRGQATEPKVGEKKVFARQMGVYATLM